MDEELESEGVVRGHTFLFEDLGPIRLYRDDIEDLEVAFKSVCRFSYWIETGGYIFKSAADLDKKALAARRNDFVMGCKDPYVVLGAHGKNVRLEQMNLDDMQVVGLATRVRAILDARRGRRPRFLRLGSSQIYTRRSTDPSPSFWNAHPGMGPAIAGAVVVAIASGIVTVILVMTGFLRPTL